MKNGSRLLLLTIFCLSCALPAFSAENENTVSSDTSTNPVTGTTTTTRKHHVKTKHANGKTSEKDVEKKTSVKKDGATEETTTTTESPAK